MRIYISADIEGVAAVVNREHTRAEGFEFREARRWMTREVLAAIEGVRAHAPSAEVVVSDSHGSGLNLTPDDLPDDVRLVRSWPRGLDMMEGVQNGRFDGAILLGYHSSASSMGGVLAHTFSTAAIAEVRVGGRPVSEAVFNGALAGHFEAPVIMLSGDDVFVEEARPDFPDAEYVVTKRACGRLSAECLPPEQVRRLIREACERAASRAAEIEPLRFAGPLEVEVELLSRMEAELFDYLPCFERIAPRTLRFRPADITEAARMMTFITMHRHLQ